MRNDFLAFISSRLLAILISSFRSHADFFFVPKSLFSKRNSHTCATINNSLKLSIEISKKSIKIITTFVTFCRRDRKRSEPTIKRSKGKFQCCLNQNDPKDPNSKLNILKYPRTASLKQGTIIPLTFVQTAQRLVKRVHQTSSDNSQIVVCSLALCSSMFPFS